MENIYNELRVYEYADDKSLSWGIHLKNRRKTEFTEQRVIYSETYNFVLQ